MNDWKSAAAAGERAAEMAIKAAMERSDVTPLAAAIAAMPDHQDAFIAGFAEHLAQHVLAAGAA